MAVVPTSQGDMAYIFELYLTHKTTTESAPKFYKYHKPLFGYS
jgi:hypothetical protein